MMDSRPARNDLLEWEKTETGEAQIKVVRQETWKTRLLSKVFYIPETRTITLDEVGTEVWQMCDGHTSVATMIDRLSGSAYPRHGITRHQKPWLARSLLCMNAPTAVAVSG